jgi:diguanylate cyclase (GGDEF)-like protein/PAS domain S-box-containing protein
MNVQTRTELGLEYHSTAAPFSSASGIELDVLEALAGFAKLQAYREALDRAAIVATTDLSGRITDVNTLFCEISGYNRAELIGASHRIVNSGHHGPEFFRTLWRSISSGDVWRGDICNRAKCGRMYWVDTTIAPFRDGSGRISGYASIRFDISDRKAAEAKVFKELRRRENAEGLLSDIVEAIPNGLIAFDPDGQILFRNRAFRHFGGEDKLSVAHEARPPATQQPDMPGSRTPVRVTDAPLLARPYIRQVDEDRWIQVHNRRSATGNLVSVQTDISELKRAELQIKDQAEKDALTGLPNRAALLRRLHSLSAARAGQERQRLWALMILDLDDFKAINDRFGHDGGDALLQAIAARLRGTVRKGDMVARLGGDEFAILLDNLRDSEDVHRIARQLLEVVRCPVKIGQQAVVPASSIGVSLFPQDGKTPKELYKNADLALYQAKLSGKNRHAAYSSAMREERKRRAHLLEKLRTALARRELHVALQPQSDIRTGRHAGFEALVRWQVGANQIPPSELVSIAEEAGLIGELSYQVIDKALGIMAGLKRGEFAPGTVAFNIATAQLLDAEFPERLLELVESHGLSTGDIEIEVTENVILDRSAGDIAAALDRLHATGMSIALDDFGTGYASLTHLKRFPIKRLKIDRSFVDGILEKKDDEVIVRTIISLAHSLGFEVVAEGVETREQYQQLSNWGCDFAQGYLLAQPMNDVETHEYLQASRRSWPVTKRIRA